MNHDEIIKRVRLITERSSEVEKIIFSQDNEKDINFQLKEINASIAGLHNSLMMIYTDLLASRD